MIGVGIKFAPAMGYGAGSSVEPLIKGSLGVVPGPVCGGSWERKRPGA